MMLLPVFATAVALIGIGMIVTEWANEPTIQYRFTEDDEMDFKRADELVKRQTVLDRGRSYVVRASYRDAVSGVHYVRLRDTETGANTERFVQPHTMYAVV